MLTVWVIYYGAKNHPPGKWVVRAQDAGVSEFKLCQWIRSIDEMIAAYDEGKPWKWFR